MVSKQPDLKDYDFFIIIVSLIKAWKQFYTSKIVGT